MEGRIVCWFSHGVASAVATKIAIQEHKGDEELVVATIFIEDEHPDNERFRRECEAWFGQEIIELRSDKYNASVDDVIAKTRYMSGPSGARCTKELKKQVRLDWQRHDDVHVFGMTVEEEHRIDRLHDNENEIRTWSPLIEQGLTKKDCFPILADAGIEVPMMYRLGFANNNCAGCLKATGAGYWNRTREVMPEVYAKRARQEQLLGVSLIKLAKRKFLKHHPEVYEAILKEEKETGKNILKESGGTIRMPLRFLPEGYGSLKSMIVPDCGFFCASDDVVVD